MGIERKVGDEALVRYLVGANTEVNAVKRAHILHLQLLQQSQGVGAGKDLQIISHKILATALHVAMSVDIVHLRRCLKPIHHLALRGHLLVVPRTLSSVSGQADEFSLKDLEVPFYPKTIKDENASAEVGASWSSSVPWRDEGAVRTCTASEVPLGVAGLQVTLSRNSQLALCGQIPQPIHRLQICEHLLAGAQGLLSFKPLDALEDISNAAHCLWSNHCICATM
jgi:hypothetical protein